jgi:hypothetical protein
MSYRGDLADKQRDAYLRDSALAAKPRLADAMNVTNTVDAVGQFHSFLAEREGFEPSIEFPLYTLSRRAPSTTRPSLQN